VNKLLVMDRGTVRNM